MIDSIPLCLPFSTLSCTNNISASTSPGESFLLCLSSPSLQSSWGSSSLEKILPRGKWSNGRQVIKATGADAPNSSKDSVKAEDLGSSDEDNVDTEANPAIYVTDSAGGEINMPPTFKEALGIVSFFRPSPSLHLTRARSAVK